MYFVLTSIDKPNTKQLRLDKREAHIDYLEQTGVVEIAGPFLDEDGQMCGSLIILKVDSRKDAENWAENDPYAMSGLFEISSLRAWKRFMG